MMTNNVDPRSPFYRCKLCGISTTNPHSVCSSHDSDLAAELRLGGIRTPHRIGPDWFASDVAGNPVRVADCDLGNAIYRLS
jgi:hypothetical protein